MRSRREFLQLAAVSASYFAAMPNFARAAAQQRLTQNDLLNFDSKGQVTLLHLTDMHGQLKPVYFRPPSENYGVGAFEGIPPHLVGETFLDHFAIPADSAYAYAHTMVDYVSLAKAYGKLGGWIEQPPSLRLSGLNAVKTRCSCLMVGIPGKALIRHCKRKAQIW